MVERPPEMTIKLLLPGDNQVFQPDRARFQFMPAVGSPPPGGICPRTSYLLPRKHRRPRMGPSVTLLNLTDFKHHHFRKNTLFTRIVTLMQDQVLPTWECRPTLIPNHTTIVSEIYVAKFRITRYERFHHERHTLTLSTAD
jgi:hypothetical protein